jgi:hypothetical protein
MSTDTVPTRLPAVQNITQQRPSIYGHLTTKLTERSIRLIQLLPGDDVGIRCELYETTLELSKSLYKALSYTWHTPQDSQKAIISCNGRTLRIGTNLYAALRRLKQRTQPVTLWVDFLCINQADDEERTHQVSMMRDIFANCNEVIIWLGVRGREDDLGQWADGITLADDGDYEDLDRRVKFYGDIRDLSKLQPYLAHISSGQRNLSSEVRDVYGAFCVISMLAQGMPASKLWYLRHLDHSPPIMRGLAAIIEKPWVSPKPSPSSQNRRQLTHSRYTVAENMGCSGDRSGTEGDGVLQRHLAAVGGFHGGCFML